MSFPEREEMRSFFVLLKSKLLLEMSSHGMKIVKIHFCIAASVVR